MNKKLKFSLFGFAGLAAAGTIGGVTAGVLLNQNQTTLNSNSGSNNISNGSSSVIQNNTVDGYSLKTTFDEQSQTFKISVKNGKSGLGVLKLLDASKITNKLSNPQEITSSDVQNSLVDTIEGKTGQEVFVAVFTEQGVEARNLKVFGANPNIMLETNKIDTPTILMQKGWVANLFSFELPTKVQIVDSEETKQDESTGLMEEPGFPIDKEGNITVTATYVKTQVAGWTWNYNYKSYVLDLQEDTILDDNDSNFNIENIVENGDVETSKLDTIPFIIFLNNHDLKVKTFTIPSGVTLYIINSSSNTTPKQEDSTKEITLANDKSLNLGFVLEGVIANYSGVKIAAPIHSKSDLETIGQNYKDGKYDWDYDWSKENK